MKYYILNSLLHLGVKSGLTVENTREHSVCKLGSSGFKFTFSLDRSVTQRSTRQPAIGFHDGSFLIGKYFNENNKIPRMPNKTQQLFQLIDWRGIDTTMSLL